MRVAELLTRRQADDMQAWEQLEVGLGEIQPVLLGQRSPAAVPEQPPTSWPTEPPPELEEDNEQTPW